MQTNPAQEHSTPHWAHGIKEFFLRNPFSQALQAIMLGFLWGYMDWTTFYDVIENVIDASLIFPIHIFFCTAQIFLPIFLALSLYRALQKESLPSEISTIKQPKWYIGLHIIHSFYNSIKSGKALLILHAIGCYLHNTLGIILFSISFANLCIVNMRISLSRARNDPLEIETNPIHLLYSCFRVIVSVVKMHTMFCIAFGLSLTHVSGLIVVPILLLFGILTQAVKQQKPDKKSLTPLPNNPSLVEYFVQTIFQILIWNSSLTNSLFATHTLLSGFFNIPMIRICMSFLFANPQKYVHIIKGFLNLSLAMSFHENNHRYVVTGANEFKKHIESTFVSIKIYFFQHDIDNNSAVQANIRPAT